jgi:hypothetical protein
MLKNVAAKVLYLAKGAALFWGLALTLALLLGAAATALAAVPGDPFRLGKTNPINNAITALVGTKSGGPMLVLDNDSSAAGSRALDLRVAPSRSPMVVSPGAGKAKNLNADKLDNLEPFQIKGAKAYARVILNTQFGGLGFDPARTSGFADVDRIDTGEYCLTAPGLSPADHIAITSVDFSTTALPQATASAMPVAQGCGDGGFRVYTQRMYTATGSGGDLAVVYTDDIGFVIAVT